MYLRQSTSQVIRFGPHLDSTDGVTAETGLTIAQADMQLSKDGAAFAQKSAAGNATHDTDGWYSTTLSTTDTGTVGELYMQVVVAGSLPVWVRYWVIEEALYDAVYGAGATAPATAAALATVDSNVDAILVDTGTSLPTDIAALNDLSAANVNAEVVDVLTVDTIAELAQAKPAATPTFATALMLLYMTLRNKLDVIAALLEIHNDAGTVIAKKALSDDGTTYSEAEMESGP